MPRLAHGRRQDVHLFPAKQSVLPCVGIEPANDQPTRMTSQPHHGLMGQIKDVQDSVQNDAARHVLHSNMGRHEAACDVLRMKHHAIPIGMGRMSQSLGVAWERHPGQAPGLLVDGGCGDTLHLTIKSPLNGPFQVPEGRPAAGRANRARLDLFWRRLWQSTIPPPGKVTPRSQSDKETTAFDRGKWHAEATRSRMAASPTTTGRLVRRTASSCRAFRQSSGPTPAGSPMVMAMRFTWRLAIVPVQDRLSDTRRMCIPSPSLREERVRERWAGWPDRDSNPHLSVVSPPLGGETMVMRSSAPGQAWFGPAHPVAPGYPIRRLSIESCGPILDSNDQP